MAEGKERKAVKAVAGLFDGSWRGGLVGWWVGVDGFRRLIYVGKYRHVQWVEGFV